MNRKIKYCQDISSSQLDLCIQSNQNPTCYFVGIDKLFLTFTWKNKIPRIANTILEKNKVGELNTTQL